MEHVRVYVSLFPLCPAPSIDNAGGKKHADFLSTPQANEFPRAPPVLATRRYAGHGHFLLLRFLFT